MKKKVIYAGLAFVLASVSMYSNAANFCESGSTGICIASTPSGSAGYWCYVDDSGAQDCNSYIHPGDVE